MTRGCRHLLRRVSCPCWAACSRWAISRECYISSLLERRKTWPLGTHRIVTGSPSPTMASVTRSIG